MAFVIHLARLLEAYRMETNSMQVLRTKDYCHFSPVPPFLQISWERWVTKNSKLYSARYLCLSPKGRVMCLIVNRKAPLLTLARCTVVNSLKQLNRIVELSQYLFHPGAQGYQQTVWRGGGYNLCNNKIFFEIKDYILKIIFKRYRNKGQDLTRFLFILRECRTYKVSY